MWVALIRYLLLLYIDLGAGTSLQKVARSLPTAHHALLPPPNCLTQSYPSTHSVSQLRTSLEDVLREVEGVQIHPTALSACTPKSGEGSDDFTIRVEAVANSWSRAARRRAKQNPTLEFTSLFAGTETKTGRPQLVVLIRSVASPQSQNRHLLECIWLQGLDRPLFESFWAHVSRKVGTRLESLAKD